MKTMRRSQNSDETAPSVLLLLPQATGDLSAKQLCNIVQMYGDEPLTKAEAEKFTK